VDGSDGGRGVNRDDSDRYESEPVRYESDDPIRYESELVMSNSIVLNHIVYFMVQLGLLTFIKTDSLKFDFICMQ